MELTFLGRGAGFNPNEGSTSAYFMARGELFLIDSGESVFRSVINLKLLDSASKLNLFITHTHSDHVGSLGSLILYAFAVKKIQINIIYDENMTYLPSVKTLLVIYGLTDNMFNFVKASEYSGKYAEFNSVRYISVKHTDELEACSLLFETDKGIVLYSGDLKDSSVIIDLVKSKHPIDKLYIDTNSDRKNPHHVSVHEVNDIVPQKLKSKVYCMHVNNVQCIDDAVAYGFNVVTI